MAYGFNEDKSRADTGKKELVLLGQVNAGNDSATTGNITTGITLASLKDQYNEIEIQLISGTNCTQSIRHSTEFLVHQAETDAMSGKVNAVQCKEVICSTSISTGAAQLGSYITAELRVQESASPDRLKLSYTRGGTILPQRRVLLFGIK